MYESKKMGEGGNCLCLNCGKKILHPDGIPCRDLYCPECGEKMIREGSDHHKDLIKKNKNKSKK